MSSFEFKELDFVLLSTLKPALLLNHSDTKLNRKPEVHKELRCLDMYTLILSSRINIFEFGMGTNTLCFKKVFNPWLW